MPATLCSSDKNAAAGDGQDGKLRHGLVTEGHLHPLSATTGHALIGPAEKNQAPGPEQEPRCRHRRGAEDKVTPDVERTTGRPSRRLEQFGASAFGPAG
jgi:hypothetical protein